MDRDKTIETLNKYISCHDREGECDYICEECKFDITHDQLMDAIRTVTNSPSPIKKACTIEIHKTKTVRVDHITEKEMRERFSNINSYLADSKGIIMVDVIVD